MKTCKQGHKYSDKYCRVCNRNACADRYRRNAEQIAAKRKADKELFEFLKAQFAEAETQIAANQ